MLTGIHLDAIIALRIQSEPTTVPVHSSPPTARKTPHQDGGVPRLKRSANGVSEKPIALRLRPEEREEVERLSALRNVAMAAFSADCFRRGLAVIKREQGPFKRAKGGAA
jgi:hypothetical protein